MYSSNDIPKEATPIQQLSNSNQKIKIIHSDQFDWTAKNHGIFDGMTKAESRKNCTGDMLWQFDVDEILHENHVSLVRNIANDLYNTRGIDLLALPVIDFWGRNSKVRIDVNIWKWRLSKNNPDITHGIPVNLRKYENGLLYAKQGTDGCDYISMSTGLPIQCATYLHPEIDQVRYAAITDKRYVSMIQDYVNKSIEQLPCVFHYSWFNIDRKIKNFKQFWNSSWNSLYNVDIDEKNNPFFPGKTWEQMSDEMISLLSRELENKTGGHVFHSPWDGSQKNHINVNMNHPKIMNEWLNVWGK